MNSDPTISRLKPYDSRGMACYYVTDHLGSNIAVVDSLGRIVQRTDYYPYGLPWREPEERRYFEEDGELTDSSKVAAPNRWLFGGKEMMGEDGLAQYDFHARDYLPAIPRFDRMDPLCERHHGHSPYLPFAANPVMYTDPTGCDTVWVKFDSESKIWDVQKSVISRGTDCIVAEQNGASRMFRFGEGEYGERVIGLCLDVNDEYSMSLIHVSGEKNGSFFAVTPGGESSNEKDSGKRVNDGTYPILPPYGNPDWRRPGLGGDVATRGIRFHYGMDNIRAWSEGCFVLCRSYNFIGGGIQAVGGTSLGASNDFDNLLGAKEQFEYLNKKGKKRIGSLFPNGINKLFIYKSR